MKRIWLLLLFIQFTTNLIAAEDSTVVKNSFIKNTNRDFYLNEQLKVYTFLPTQIGLWTNGDFSLISANGSVNKGEFRLTDQFKKDKQFSFKTESIQSFKDSGWAFYGSFSLNISDHKTTNWNLGYKKSEIGSPFSLITQRSGDFNVKHYGLSGIMNKKLGGKISLALGLKYKGDLYFRLRDTRNEFYNFTTEFTGGIRYAMNKNNYWSLGLSYYYKKGSPKFSNVYYGADEEYKMYFNEGLGDFGPIDDLSNKYILKNQNPKYYIGYHSAKKNILSLSYSAYFGNERWENEIKKEADPNIYQSHKNLYKYEYSSQEFTGSYLIKNPNYNVFNSLKIKYINGSAYRYRGFYEKTYIYNGLNINALSKLTRPNSNLFYLNTLSINLENSSRKDMIYAHQIKYTNLFATAKTGYSIKINPTNTLSIDIEGTYKHNLSYMHDPVSAGNKPYTLNLAYNEVAYHTANFYKLGMQAKWQRNIKNNCFELFIKYNYLKPTDIKINNQYSILSKDDTRNYLGTGLNFYF